MKLQFFKTLTILAMSAGDFSAVIGSDPQGGVWAVRPSPAAANTYRGGLVSPLLPAGFTLTDTSGAAYDFSAKTQDTSHFCFSGTRIARICVRCRCI